MQINPDQPGRLNRISTSVEDATLSIAAAVQVALSDRRERGATAVEYALLLGLMTIAIIGGVSVFRTKLSTAFNTYTNTIP